MPRAKRLMDLGLLALLAPVLLPLLGGLAVLLLLRQGRPVFFGSERMRSPQEGFTLWKLRSMHGVTNDHGVSGGDKAARITPLGRHLRRMRLDELPQMVNILRGDISFVGPRPPLRSYVVAYPQIYGAVLRMPPGVTGLASLVYAPHETRLLARCRSAAETDALYRRACIPRKARLDLIYQRHQSLGFDLWLVGLTSARVIGLGGGTGRGGVRRLPRPPRWRKRH
ncbi:MAG: sugar transferase [Rhodobacteraceae bacterium]|nr:MAG: sugar transferase [Paracoccaceae bacterium]